MGGECDPIIISLPVERWANGLFENRGQGDSTPLFSFQSLSNATEFAHPITWQDLFNPNTRHYGIITISEFLANALTVDALSKLLMFGDYVRAKAEAQSTSVSDIVMKELGRYPYARKTVPVNPYFTPTDLKGSYPHINFRAAITDAGVCQVYNGDTLHSTIKQSARNTQLKNSLDPRTAGLRISLAMSDILIAVA